jgi:hypothetical protein
MAVQALNNGADRVFIMGYSYRTSGTSPAGSISPIARADGAKPDLDARSVRLEGVLADRSCSACRTTALVVHDHGRAPRPRRFCGLFIRRRPRLDRRNRHQHDTAEGAKWFALRTWRRASDSDVFRRSDHPPGRTVASRRASPASGSDPRLRPRRDWLLGCHRLVRDGSSGRPGSVRHGRERRRRRRRRGRRRLRRDRSDLPDALATAAVADDRRRCCSSSPPESRPRRPPSWAA